MIRTAIKSLFAAALMLGLPACAFSASVETLLSPPRLTVEQEQIYRALQAAVGNTISLKYPKSGERLSAFTVDDLDGDGSDEAIVFYTVNRTNTEENPLRLCLLAQENGVWRAMAEYPAAGAEVDRFDIETLGSNPRKNLIIRYSMVDGANHTVEVLHYDEMALTRTLSLPYAALAIRDLNGDGTRELLVLSGMKAESSATATVYYLDENGNYLRSQAALPEAVTEITSIGYGMLPESSGAGVIPAVYVDGASGATTAQTVVLTYCDSLLSVVYADIPDRFPNTAHPVSWVTADIDGDGEREIPVQTSFYGYTGADVSSPLSMTNWYVCRGGLLMRERSSYYAAAEGYVFLMPQRWERRVTAVQEKNEIVFCEYTQDPRQPDGAPLLGAPLLRLTTTADSVEAETLQEQGWLLMQTCDGRSYLARCEKGTDSALELTASELIFSMKYISR